MRPCPALPSPFLAAGLLALAVSLHAEVVAINSQVFNSYARTKAADGGFQPEAYTFGEGGCWSRALKDPWMEQLKFIDVARAASGPLAQANFRPALKAADATLLILVYWGSTQGSMDLDQNDVQNRTGAAISAYDRAQDPAEKNRPPLDRKTVDSRTPEGAAYESFLWQTGVSNRMRDELDERNARILGYTEALSRARFAQHLSSNHDIVEELAGNRYYVVLQAFDFKAATKEKKLRPLWTTRLSVSEQGDFNSALARMLATGQRYFGRDTDGLKRERQASAEPAPAAAEAGETPPQK